MCKMIFLDEGNGDVDNVIVFFGSEIVYSGVVGGCNVRVCRCLLVGVDINGVMS